MHGATAERVLPHVYPQFPFISWYNLDLKIYEHLPKVPWTYFVWERPFAHFSVPSFSDLLRGHPRDESYKISVHRMTIRRTCRKFVEMDSGQCTPLDTGPSVNYCTLPAAPYNSHVLGLSVQLVHLWTLTTTLCLFWWPNRLLNFQLYTVCTVDLPY